MNSVFLDDYIASINYPFGPIAHEPMAVTTAEMILEMANQIKLQEDYSKWSFHTKSEMPNLTQLLMTIFEVGDFTFFKNLLNVSLECLINKLELFNKVTAD